MTGLGVWRGKRRLCIIVCALFVLIAGFGSFFSVNPLTVIKKGDNRVPLAKRGNQLNYKKAEGEALKISTGASKHSVEDRLVSEIKTFYGKTISEKSTQVILLKAKRFVSQLYPEDGEKRFYAILNRAFPDLADEIEKILAKLEKYQHWLKENENALARMSSLEQKRRLWGKRYEIFGDDAGEIWSEEVLAYEKRKENVRYVLKFLGQSDDIPIYEKIDIYKTALQEAYQDSPEAYVLQNKDMLAKVFFGLDSVQNELKKLDPEKRRLEISRIRNGMGLSQEQIEKMAQNDEYKERRWKNGMAYMRQRERVSKELEGGALDKRLRELREKYFKHEAKTIALEEKDNFFRFNRPRVYGRN
jgi:hypothetical protein